MENTFDPVKYSLEENQFLYQHLGKPPIVALQSIPDKVNIRAVKPVLERVYELSELQKHSQVGWKGVEELKAAIQAYLDQSKKWLETKRRFRGAPRFPSMSTFDRKGRAHPGGPDSDSGFVKTYFDEKGNRVPFAVNLVDDETPSWKPDWVEETPAVPEQGLITDLDKNRIECFCGHTESFKSESAASQRAARARMSKHLRASKSDVDRHREVYTMEFGS